MQSSASPLRSTPQGFLSESIPRSTTSNPKTRRYQSAVSSKFATVRLMWSRCLTCITTDYPQCEAALSNRCRATAARVPKGEHIDLSTADPVVQVIMHPRQVDAPYTFRPGVQCRSSDDRL